MRCTTKALYPIIYLFKTPMTHGQIVFFYFWAFIMNNSCCLFCTLLSANTVWKRGEILLWAYRNFHPVPQLKWLQNLSIAILSVLLLWLLLNYMVWWEICSWFDFLAVGLTCHSLSLWHLRKSILSRKGSHEHIENTFTSSPFPKIFPIPSFLVPFAKQLRTSD
jgi:hypothetical protein